MAPRSKFWSRWRGAHRARAAVLTGSGTGYNALYRYRIQNAFNPVNKDTTVAQGVWVAVGQFIELEMQ